MNLTSPQSKFDKLRNRHLPIDKRTAYFNEEYCRANKQTSFKYMVETMQPISDEYTEETFQQGDRVAPWAEARSHRVAAMLRENNRL